MMTSDDLKKKFISFFESKGHVAIPSASIIPENDNTVLFNTAGMQPLVPYLSGNIHPSGNRLVNYQKCIRTNDIDEVGDDNHLTFFEMLGNWSLGDYFKKESIEWSYEFLTDKKWLGLDPKRLAFTCYEGNEKFNVPKDDVSYKQWISLGVHEKRIEFMGDDNNWWPKMGIDGLCGPDTEIFYWVPNDTPAPDKFDTSDSRWVEIWNNVFMEFSFKNGALEKLDKQNVDTGMGLERTLAVLNGCTSVYETDIFRNIIDKILEMGKLSRYQYEQDNLIRRSVRIIADHIRAATIITGDRNGVGPSNVDQGYVVRKLLRRAIRNAFKINIHEHILNTISKLIIDQYIIYYSELDERQSFILGAFEREENLFRKTLQEGERVFDKKIRTYSDRNILNGEDVFDLYTTYGYPFELIAEMSVEYGFAGVDKEGFEKLFKEHQNKSREGATQKFAGGLADTSKENVRLHTASHLLLQALRMVLGDHVEQKGSNITPERLRFDFPNPQKVTPEELKKVEDIVNEQIKKSLPVTCETMSREDAKRSGAMGVFDEKYNKMNELKVYSIGDFSKEICGGPHVENTAELEGFKILKEEASSAGIRRIKATVLANKK